MDIVAYLTGKGLRVKDAGPNNVNVPCVFCGEDPQKRGRLYIATGPTEDAVGLYDCKLCGARGNLRTLKRHFGDQDDVVDDSYHLQHRVLQEAAKFYADNLHPQVLEWLKKERFLTAETILEHQFGWAPSEDPVALYRHLRSKGFEVKDILATGLCVERGEQKRIRDFLQGVVTIPYHVHGNVVMIRGKDMQGKYVTPPNQKTRMFNTDALTSADEVVITEGEFDALVLEQMGFNAAASPGSNVWQDSWDGYFVDTKLVYLVFDPDEPGRKGAQRIKERLGHKAKIVDLPVPSGVAAKDVDPSAMVGEGATRETFEVLFRESLMANSLLVTVDQAFEEWEAVQGVDGLKLGFEELDTAIRPGLLPGQVCIVLAKTNTGKTIILLNMFQRIAMSQPDAHILFVSLEQTRGDWFERARRIWNFYDLSCPKDEVNERTLDFWRPRLEIVDRNRISEEELVSCIREYEMRHGKKPDVVAVDYLGYWAAGFKERDRYQKVTEAVMSLKAVAKEQRVVIISPHQVNRVAEFGQEFEVDQARDSGAVEETADFVFGLWNPDTMKGVAVEDRSGVVNLKIGKSRHGGKGNLIKLQFAPLTLVMVPIEDQTGLRLAKDELRYALQRDTWEAAIFRHRTGIQDLDIERMVEAS